MADGPVYGPRLNLFKTRLPTAELQPGAIHIRSTGVLTKGTATRPPSMKWAIIASTVRPDGSEKPILRAHGTAPARSTHGAAYAHTPDRPTEQAAHQAAIEAASSCAVALARREGAEKIYITPHSATTLIDMRNARQRVLREERNQRAREPDPAPRIKRARHTRKPRGTKRRNEDDTTSTTSSPRTTHHRHAEFNARTLEHFCRRNPQTTLIARAPHEATPLELIAHAHRAAGYTDLHARVTRGNTERTGPLWTGNRVWDPGD